MLWRKGYAGYFRVILRGIRTPGSSISCRNERDSILLNPCSFSVE